mmetsp:Transcript_66081/g.196654  ORF Transcript_66081/g.196654 Transcript_66081/m.196654 type:complete len:211 (+) Transcript_66081:682-1314(+)
MPGLWSWRGACMSGWSVRLRSWPDSRREPDSWNWRTQLLRRFVRLSWLLHARPLSANAWPGSTPSRGLQRRRRLPPPGPRACSARGPRCWRRGAGPHGRARPWRRRTRHLPACARSSARSGSPRRSQPLKLGLKPRRPRRGGSRKRRAQRLRRGSARPPKRGISSSSAGAWRPRTASASSGRSAMPRSTRKISGNARWPCGRRLSASSAR